MAKPKHPPGPPMTLGKLWHSQLVHVAVVCVPILVSGCAETDLLSPVAPGKYDFLDCPSITKRLARALYEEANLARLMTRASEAADGAFVNAIVYQDQYTPRVRSCEICAKREKSKNVRRGPEPTASRATGLRWPKAAAPGRPADDARQHAPARSEKRSFDLTQNRLRACVLIFQRETLPLPRGQGVRSHPHPTQRDQAAHGIAPAALQSGYSFGLPLDIPTQLCSRAKANTYRQVFR